MWGDKTHFPHVALWAVLHLGRCSWVVQGAGGASYGEQASRQNSSMIKAQIASTKVLHFLSYRCDIPQGWTVTCEPNKHFLFQAEFGCGLYYHKRKQTRKTVSSIGQWNQNTPYGRISSFLLQWIAFIMHK